MTKNSWLQPQTQRSGTETLTNFMWSASHLTSHGNLGLNFQIIKLFKCRQLEVLKLPTDPIFFFLSAKRNTSVLKGCYSLWSYSVSFSRYMSRLAHIHKKYWKIPDFSSDYKGEANINLHLKRLCSPVKLPFEHCFSQLK